MNNSQEYEIRYRLLKLINENPLMTQRELASTMGISLGKLNFCITQLVNKGLIKINRFKNSKQKSGYIYKLTPCGIEEKAKITIKFLKQKQHEYEQIKRLIEELTNEMEKVQMDKQNEVELDSDSKQFYEIGINWN